MKKKGFTLIELLAVLVILSMIALITTVTIVSILDDSIKSLSDRQKRNIEAAAETYYLKEGININNTCISVEELIQKGYIDAATVKDPEDSEEMTGYVRITYASNQYTYKYQENSCRTCTYDDIDGDKQISLSDVVTCGTEKFYVMENSNHKITMLSMYNLYVGYLYEGEDMPERVILIENPTGIQNENARGWVNGLYKHYGLVIFSNGSYWTNENYTPAGDSSYQYVYDSNSNLYQYVSAYETYLKENGVSSAQATLMSYEQFIDLKENHGYPSWVYFTDYWTGSACNDSSVFNVHSHSGTGCSEPGYDRYGYINGGGVRPVITISINEINLKNE